MQQADDLKLILQKFDVVPDEIECYIKMFGFNCIKSVLYNNRNTCFPGRKHAKNNNSSIAQGKKRRPILVSNYSTCDKKMSRFLKSKQKQQA